MEIIVKNADELVQTLMKTHEAALELMQCALNKEDALREDDVQKLKDILEQEEDVLGEFALLEKKRLAQTAALSQALGLDEQDVSLRQIAGKIDDENVSAALLEIGVKLSETVTQLRDKNAVLAEVINLKNDYAGVILEALTVGRETTRSYNASGAINNQADAEPGVVEYFA